MKATVLISLYKSQKFIQNKIENIMEQTIFKECEFMFIDGGTNDDELDIIRRFIIGKHNCHLIANKKGRITLYEAWNRGIKASSAPYICNSNTDDVLAPNAIERLIESLDGDNNISVTFPNVYTTTKPNSKWGTVTGGYINTSANAVVGPFVMWRRSLHSKYGLFDGRLWVYGDAHWWNLLRSNHVVFKKVPDHLCIYLVGNGLERSCDDSGELLRVKDAKLLNLPKGSVEGW